MYDLHVEDRFMSPNGRVVTVVQIDLDGRVQYEFESTGAKRWADRVVFLERFPHAIKQ